MVHYLIHKCKKLHTYLLTPWSTVLLGKLTGFQLVKKIPAFRGTRRFITSFISTRNYTLIYLLTYSMQHSPSWEANQFSASQEIPRISGNPKVHYLIHKHKKLHTYLLTYSMKHSPSWEANRFSASQEIPHISGNLKVHYLIHKHKKLHTYLLTPCSTVLGKLTGFQLVKKFPAFCGTRRFITSFTSARNYTLTYSLTYSMQHSPS